MLLFGFQGESVALRRLEDITKKRGDSTFATDLQDLVAKWDGEGDDDR